MADKENEGMIKEAMEDAAVDRQEGVAEHERSETPKKNEITKKEAIKAQTIL
jgi:hypothetical protein